jgi:hypothetical protein
MPSSAHCIDRAGNVDCAEWITPIDALRIMRHAAGLPPLTQSNCKAIGTEILAGATSFDLIEAALTAGDIDAETALTYEVFASFSDSRLPAQYTGDDVGGEPMAILDRAAQSYSDFSAQTQADLDPFLKRPDEPGSWLTLDTVGSASRDAQPAADPAITWTKYPAVGGKVKIWAQDRYPADAAKAAAIASAMTSRIWPMLLTVMDREPVADTGLANNGGDGALDIYLVNPPLEVLEDEEGYEYLGKPWVGLAVPAEVDNCDLGPRYLLLDNTYPLGGERSSGILQTAVHEVFHAFQFAFPFSTGCWTPEYGWFVEASATWSEQHVYPLANSEHGAAPDFVESQSDPHLPLDFYEYLHGHQYGAYLFPYFLEKTVGVQTIRSIFTSFGLLKNLDAIDSKVPGGLRKTFPKFANHLWNRDSVDFFTKWDKMGYLWYPKADKLAVPSGTTYSLDVQEPHLHAAFYSFIFPENVKKIEFKNSIVSEGLTHGAVYAIAKIGDEWKEPVELDQPEKHWCRQIPEEDVTELVLVVSNADASGEKTLEPVQPPELKSKAFCDDWTGTVSYSYHYSGDSGQRDISTDGTIQFGEQDDPLTLDRVEYVATGGSLRHSYTDHNPLPNACETNAIVGVTDGSLAIYPESGHYFGRLTTDQAPDPDCLGGGTTGNAKIGSTTVGRFKLSDDGNTLEGGYSEVINDFGTHTYHYSWKLTAVRPPAPPP